MKFEILHTVIGSSVYDNDTIHDFPKKCIECGLVLPFEVENKDQSMYVLKYYGSVKDLKGNPIWTFEISVHFQIDKTNQTPEGEVQGIIDEFMDATYQRAASTFENFVKGKPSIDGYVLCPLDVLKLDKSFFI